MQRLRRFSGNKYSNDQVKPDTAASTVQLPSKLIDCLPVQENDTEKVAVDVPLKTNSNDSSNIDDVPVEQLPCDEPAADTQNNPMVHQEGK